LKQHLTTINPNFVDRYDEFLDLWRRAIKTSHIFSRLDKFHLGPVMLPINQLAYVIVVEHRQEQPGGSPFSVDARETRVKSLPERVDPFIQGVLWSFDCFA
jgi:hypothetical protein